MQNWSQRYATTFGLGFIVFCYAVGVGAAQGDALTTDNAILYSLRYLGEGFMGIGLALWIAKMRIEGNRPGLNPLFGLLSSFSALLLLLGVVVALTGGGILETALKGGLWAATTELVIGLLAMVISPIENRVPDKDKPAYPWMVEGFDPEKDAYAAGQTVPTYGYVPEDLERIAGLDTAAKEKLAGAAIHSFSQLASTSPEKLQEILDDYTLDTSTWPDQARLAENKEWDLLNEFQQVIKQAMTG